MRRLLVTAMLGLALLPACSEETKEKVEDKALETFNSAQREAAEAKEKLADLQGKLDRHMSQIESLLRQKDELQRALADAKDEAERRDIRGKLREIEGAVEIAKDELKELRGNQ